MANYQELANLVWNVADDVLRGLFKPHEYGDITLPFLVLRRLDCILTEDDRKDKSIESYNRFKDVVPEESLPQIILKETDSSFYNTSQYDLSRLKADPNNIRLNFNNYLNGFSKDVRDIIENFNLDQFIDRLDRNNRLFIFCDKFTEVDLHPNRVDNHTMGQVFEELLRRFSEMSNETSGEHYTPRDVVRLLVSLLFAEHSEEARGQGVIRSIFDPCCGTGGMLTIGKEYFREQINPDADIRLLGQELNPQTYAICKSDMLITGEKPRRYPTRLLPLRRPVSRETLRLHDNQSTVRRQLEVRGIRRESGGGHYRRQVHSRHAPQLRRSAAIPAAHALQDGKPRQPGRNRPERLPDVHRRRRQRRK